MTTRREFVVSSASLATALAWASPQRALAQGIGNITQLEGDVLVNGNRLAPDGAIQTGDRIQTGPGSRVGFTIGGDALLLRPQTDLTLTRGASLFIIGGARMAAGALLAVFGRSARPRHVVAPTVTAGIRGTGFYVEARPESTYFCTCYGVIELQSNLGDTETVNSSRHQARRVLGQRSGTRSIVDAPFENHSDAELDQLARLVGQRAPWYPR